MPTPTNEVALHSSSTPPLENEVDAKSRTSRVETRMTNHDEENGVEHRDGLGELCG